MTSRQRTTRGAVVTPMLVLVVALFATTSCGGSSSGLHVTETEYRFAVSGTAKAGSIKINVKNAGKLIHEMRIVRLASASLASKPPTKVDGSFDLAAPGVTLVPPHVELGPGGSNSVTATLSSGTYLLVCNLEDHFKQGMVTTLTVP